MKRDQQNNNNYSFGGISIRVSKNSLKKGKKAILIGKSFSKKAVERNKLRRQLREVFNNENHKNTKKWNISVAIKKGEKDFPSTKVLKNDLEKTLERAGTLFNQS